MTRLVSLRGIAWALFATLSSFALLELAIELADAAPPALASYPIWNDKLDPELLADTGLFRYAPQCLWEPRPGVADVQLDGHRGQPLPEHEDGVLCIAAIGDATTFGNSLNSSQAWPALLEFELGEHGVAAHVLNFGVPEHSTFQGCARFAARVAAVHPDLVIACFGEYADRRYAPAGDDDAERVRRAMLLDCTCNRLTDRFSSLRWLRQVVEGDGQEPRIHSLERVPAQLMRESLQALRDTVQDGGAKLLLIAAPVPPEHPRVKEVLASSPGDLVRLAADLKVPVVRADKALAALPPSEVFLGPAWWTPNAHAIVARETLAAAQRLKLLAPRSEH